MKNINQFITEYIIKKKLDEPIDSEDHYTYFPNTKEELISNIDELLDKEISDFNCINTSKIRNMSNLFFYKNFNRKQKSILKDIDISKWDVSNVENMESMFEDFNSFNCDISNWDVSKVKSMSYMFYGCNKFNYDLSNWDVSNVTDMSYAFMNCNKFNCDVSNWNVSKVENMDEMFRDCKNFKGKGLENWDVTGKDIRGLLNDCYNINKPSWYKE